MRPPANGADFRGVSLIDKLNMDTIFFSNFSQAFDNVIKPPNVREKEILLFTLIRVPSYSLRITNDNS